MRRKAKQLKSPEQDKQGPNQHIALTEPETTFRAMNEMLYLIKRPSLDRILRNPTTGKLKSMISLLTMSHGEDPDSPLTQMCMLHLLSLSQISQRSFAEYHSKRNFVESSCR